MSNENDKITWTESKLFTDYVFDIIHRQEFVHEKNDT